MFTIFSINFFKPIIKNAGSNIDIKIQSVGAKLATKQSTKNFITSPLHSFHACDFFGVGDAVEFVNFGVYLGFES